MAIHHGALNKLEVLLSLLTYKNVCLFCLGTGNGLGSSD